MSWMLCDKRQCGTKTHQENAWRYSELISRTAFSSSSFFVLKENIAMDQQKDNFCFKLIDCICVCSAKIIFQLSIFCFRSNNPTTAVNGSNRKFILIRHYIFILSWFIRIPQKSTLNHQFLASGSLLISRIAIFATWILNIPCIRNTA